MGARQAYYRKDEQPDLQNLDDQAEKIIRAKGHRTMGVEKGDTGAKERRVNDTRIPKGGAKSKRTTRKTHHAKAPTACCEQKKKEKTTEEIGGKSVGKWKLKGSQTGAHHIATTSYILPP